MDSAERVELAHYLSDRPQPPAQAGSEYMRRVSSLWAGLYDARGAAGRNPDTGDVLEPRSSASWLAAIGYSCWFDQLGSTLLLDGEKVGGEGVLGALSRFSTLDEPEREALYALRCSLAHDYSLINPKTPQNAKKPLRWHCFQLNDSSEAIALSDPAWDGETYPPPGSTTLGLRGIGDLAESVMENVLCCWKDDRLGLAYPVEEFGARYLFWYLA